MLNLTEDIQLYLYTKRFEQHEDEYVLIVEENTNLDGYRIAESCVAAPHIDIRQYFGHPHIGTILNRPEIIELRNDHNISFYIEYLNDDFRNGPQYVRVMQSN